MPDVEELARIRFWNVLLYCFTEGSMYLSQALKKVMRASQRHPFFTLSVLALLSIAVAVHVVLFSILDATVLQATPFPQPDRLFVIRCRTQQITEFGPCTVPVSVAIREQSKEAYELAYATPDLVQLDYMGNHSWIRVEDVSSSFFSTLRSWPTQGRWFVTADNRSPTNIVIISDRFWRASLGGKPDAIGMSLFLNGKPFVVCGIMPAGFGFPNSGIQAWILDPPSIARMEEVSKWASDLVVRIRDNSNLAQFQTELYAIAQRIGDADPREDRGLTFEVVPIRRFILGNYEVTVWLLFFFTIILAIVVAANIANLLMARNLTSSKDYAIRIAVGATRGQLVRESLMEHFVLAIPVSLLSTLLAFIIMRLLQHTGGIGVPRSELASVGAKALVYGAGVSISVLLVVGLLSLWPLLATSLVGRNLAVATPPFGNSASRGLQTMFLVVQWSLALLLLVTATSAAETLWRILNLPIGFDPHNLVAVVFDSQGGEPGSIADSNTSFRPLLDDVHAIPGVVRAALSSGIPLVTGSQMMQMKVYDREKGWSITAPVEGRVVSYDYFGAARIPLLGGRLFAQEDTYSNSCATIVSRSFSRTILGLGREGEAIGKMISAGYGGSKARECYIVGVVGDARDVKVEESAPPEIYFPDTQTMNPSPALLVRVTDVDQVVPGLREVVSKWIPSRSIIVVAKLQDYVEGPTRRSRMLSYQVFFMAAVAYLISLLGVFAMSVHAVSERRLELGIRAAMGAKRLDIYLSMFRRMGLSLLVGTISGVILAYSVRQLLLSHLAQQMPMNWNQYVLAATVLAFSALIASFSATSEIDLRDLSGLLRTE